MMDEQSNPPDSEMPDIGSVIDVLVEQVFREHFEGIMDVMVNERDYDTVKLREDIMTVCTHVADIVPDKVADLGYETTPDGNFNPRTAVMIMCMLAMGIGTLHSINHFAQMGVNVEDGCASAKHDPDVTPDILSPGMTDLDDLFGPNGIV